MTTAEVVAALESLANDDNSGWVRIPGVGLVGLQGQAAKLLSRRNNSQEWTDEAARFFAAVCWAGTKAWYADPRYMRVFEENCNAVFGD